MMMVMATAPERLRQILDIRRLAALRSAGEVRGELVELGRLRRVSIRLRGFGGALEVRGDLPGDLPVFSRVGFLQLL